MSARGYKLQALNCFLRWLRDGAFGLVLLTALIACSHAPQLDSKSNKSSAAFPEDAGLYVSAAFGPDGRLWRVIPGKAHIFVDYSGDRGASFSTPLRINKEGQKIRASGENRPAIAVDPSGNIFVVYAAEGNQPSELFYSISSDHGMSFSEPKPLSDSADIANTYQGRLGLDHNGKIFVYWHDERNRTDWRQLGNAIYSTELKPGVGALMPARKISDVLCDCCRIAVAYNDRNQAVLFTRFVYEGNVRDHGIVLAGDSKEAWRVTDDDWTIEACPEHGPAISIGNDNTYHIAWFTQGQKRQGLFYALSKDGGRHFSKPMRLGNAQNLPGHPDVLAVDQHIILTWTEYDGKQTFLMIQQSADGGVTWKPAQILANASAEADYPFLLSNRGGVFVSWNSKVEGYRLLKVP